MYDEEIPKHRRRRGKKLYGIERRVKPEYWEGSVFQQLNCLSYKEWHLIRRYEKESHRDEALETYRKKEDRFEFRIQEKNGD